MARKGSATRAQDAQNEGRRAVEGARLEPLRKVERRLVSPTGEVVIVEVPVYPPFRLKTEAERGDARG